MTKALNARDEKLVSIFSNTLGIPSQSVTDNLKYSEIPEWDSVAHMTLIAAIEQEFDVMIDAEDVIDLSSFLKAKQILAKYLQ